jgi:hypothetical protein
MKTELASGSLPPVVDVILVGGSVEQWFSLLSTQLC